ncbi:hypothetical protein CGC50_05490 [Capnocytophaga gingivalis]|uniref:Uncharacterized protein n=1 Tax=Capnocytophaga gingivalis TaxID=1017 RepID=A0A250FRT0_9FLAO|nr:hypothetical protein CGC50_05490 [Capnocytophaga gingivalis]
MGELQFAPTTHAKTSCQYQCSLLTVHCSLTSAHYLSKSWIIEDFLVVLLTQAVDGRWSAPQQQAELGDGGALLAG